MARKLYTVQSHTVIGSTPVLIRATAVSRVEPDGSLRVHTGPAKWHLVATDKDDNILAAWTAGGYSTATVMGYLSNYARNFVADRLWELEN